MMLKTLILITITALVMGCAALQPTEPLVREAAAPPVSARRIEGATRASDTLSGNAVPAPDAWLPDEPLDLERAVAIAIAHNPDLCAEGWEVAAAEARRDRASAERYPRFYTTGAYMRYLDEQRLLPVRQPGDPATLSSDIVAGDLILTMPLFAGRRLANETREADYLSRAAADRFVRTRQELVYEVSSLFYRILAQRHVIASLEFSRTAIDEHIRRVQALIEARKAAPVDLLRTEVRRADLDQRLMQERSALVLQHRYLAGMLGVKDGGDTLSLRGDLETGTAEAVDIGADLEALRAAGLDNRGDVLAARRAVKAQAHRVAAERGARWPAVSLFGTYGVRWAAGETIGAGNEIDDLGRIGFSLDLSIFEGGRIGARIREENAELEALRARLRAVELRAGLEVESALLDVRTSSERIEALRTALEQASESLRIERRRYELGAGTVVDVLDAQSALLETETNYYRALAERGAAVARLRLAIGEE